MIRVQIVAHRKSSAEDLASLLSSEDSIEVVQADLIDRNPHSLLAAIDVVLAINVIPTQLSAFKVPVVLLSTEPGAPSAELHANLALNSSPRSISAAVIAAAAGLYALTSDQLHLGITPDLEETPLEKLTARELEVLNLISAGLHNKEIAVQLKISEHTAKFHVAQVLAKLGAASRAEAVRIGIRRGLVAL